MPAAARLSSPADPALTYVQARAAAINGDHAQAAQLLATLAVSEPDKADIANKALSEAIGAGRIDLALSLARTIPAAKLSTDGRLLLVADDVKHRKLDRAETWLPASGGNGDLSFLVPLLTGWDLAERGNLDQAVATIDQIPANGLLGPLQAEEHAFILLKFRRAADAEPFARRAIAAAGAREARLRLALADAFLAAGDRTRALAMIDGMGGGETKARQRITAGNQIGVAVDNGPKALSEALTAFAVDIARMQRTAAPVGLIQVARFANPANSSATALLALLLDNQKRSDEALAVLRTVPQTDPLISEIRDIQVHVLVGQKRFNDAYAVAAQAAADPGADASDFSRLGEVYGAMKRPGESADAYGRAIALAGAGGTKSNQWTLYLLRADALQDAKRWPEAKQVLQQGLALAPDQPLLLNFLGYAELERGENMDSAEAMIRKASELAPDDASIIDSLGWAELKRGKTAEAITTLQQAAEKDSSQAEIQEHLGDALYKSGQRLEARFAWSAALVTAEDDTAARVKAKLAGGLTAANAAP